MNFFKKLTKTFVDVFLTPSPKSRKKKKKSESSNPRQKKSSPRKKSSLKKSAKKVPATKKIKAAVVTKKTAGRISPKAEKQNSKAQRALKSPKPVKAPETPGKLIGQVTHFFPQVKAAALKITSASGLQVGETLQFKGATTNFKLKIVSMQINRVPVTQAAKGAEVGILVPKRVREGDEVYKL